MRQPPKFFSQLLALVLGGIGAAFVLLGVLFAWLDLPVRGGGGWSFFTLGVVLLVCAGVCLLWYAGRRARIRRLRAGGVTVESVGCSVDRRVWITWNVRGFTNLPGQNCPWTVRASYVWNGKTYTVTSPLLWAQPAPVQYPVIYVDPEHPRRAYLDPDTLSFFV